MKRIVVTGANKGIGRAVVQRLLEEHADVFVYLGARDVKRGEETRKEIVGDDAARAARVAVLEINVADDASVAAAAAAVQRDGPLYAIVNNAGCMGTPKDTFETNVFGVSRCVDAFAAVLEPAGGRIAMMSSAAGPMFVDKCTAERKAFFVAGSTTPAAKILEEARAFVAAMEGAAADGCAALAAAGYPPYQEDIVYGGSKAFLNAYTAAVAAAHPGLVVASCTPGMIDTDMLAQAFAKRGRTPKDVGALPPREGTHSIHFLLFGSPVNGAYYGSDCVRSPLDRYRAPGSAPFDG